MKNLVFVLFAILLSLGVALADSRPVAAEEKRPVPDATLAAIPTEVVKEWNGSVVTKAGPFITQNWLTLEIFADGSWKSKVLHGTFGWILAEGSVEVKVDGDLNLLGKYTGGRFRDTPIEYQLKYQNWKLSGTGQGGGSSFTIQSLK